VFVRVREGARHVAQHVDRLPRRDGSAGAAIDEPGAERLALDVGHRVVRHPTGRAGREDRHDVGVLQARRQADLAREPLGRELVRQVWRERLHDDPAAQRGLLATKTRDMPPPPSSRSSVYAAPSVACSRSRRPPVSVSTSSPRVLVAQSYGSGRPPDRRRARLHVEGRLLRQPAGARAGFRTVSTLDCYEAWFVSLLIRQTYAFYTEACPSSGTAACVMPRL
jgi:hypothetical protein